MNIISFKRRNLLLLFGTLLVFVFVYLAYSINQIEQHETFRNNKALNNNIERLKNRLDHNIKSLEKLEKKFEPRPSNVKIEDRPEHVEVFEKEVIAEPNKPHDEPFLKHRTPIVDQPLKTYHNQCEWFSEQTDMNTDIQANDLISKIAFDDKDGGVWKQGFDITYDENQWSGQNKLHVFVVPHSHNDPGWLMTYEEYFYQRTRGILDTIVNSLSEKASRKFIWAETSYLALWWNQASEDMRNKMRRLIMKTKQLEIVTGGWVMNDEANSYYYAMIEQMIEGHEWIKANIDPSIRPSYGWSIDPFGYTPTMAYLLKQMGFDAMLIQRVHYSVKKHLAETNQLEFDWRQSWSTSNSKDTSLFCHVMPFYSYDVPHTCGPDPKICCQFDFARIDKYGGCPWGIRPQQITDRNVKERAWALLDQYRKKAQLYGGKNNHNTLLVPLGDDFRYRDMHEANVQFDNYEILMNYMNSRSDWNVEIKFGTLKDYFELLSDQNAKANHAVETFSGDFFTYADREDHYWSGYFTSRPFNKRLDRVVESYLRSAEIVYSFANILTKKVSKPFAEANLLYKKLLRARRNLGLFQHHDGITGTSKTPVVEDYANKLYDCLTSTRQIIEKSASYLIGQQNSDKTIIFSLDDVRIKTGMGQSEKAKYLDLSDSTGKKTVVLWNSNLNERFEVVSFKVNSPYVEVVDSDGNIVKNIQVSMIWPNMEDVEPDDSTFKNPRMSSNENLQFAYDFDKEHFELLFEVKLAPLSFTKFVMRRSGTFQPQKSISDVIFYHNNHNQERAASIRNTTLGSMTKEMKLLGEKIQFEKVSQNENQMIQLKSGEHEAHFSSKTGFLKKIVTAANKEIKSTFKFVKYGTTQKREKSGAYLFLPDGHAIDVDFTQFMQWIRVEKNGNLRNRVCVHLTILLHCIEFYPTLDKLRNMETPILSVWNMVDLRQTHNFELAMHVTTDIVNNDEFYTDLNGFQYTKRKNYRKLTIQGNVYPMPSGAFIQDSNLRMNILTAQPLGVASQDKSSIQVFLDRRLDQDDNRGMEQPNNDNILTSSKFFIFFEPINSRNFEHSIGKSHPSLLSQILSFNLINSIVKLIAKKNEMHSTVRLGNVKKYPCDLRLVNLRTFQDANEVPMSNQVGLILHRIAHEECSTGSAVQSTSYMNSQCSSSSGFSFSDFFEFFSRMANGSNASSVNDMKISSTYLTLRDKDENVDVNPKELILKYVQPMQVEAFKVNF